MKRHDESDLRDTVEFRKLVKRVRVKNLNVFVIIFTVYIYIHIELRRRNFYDIVAQNAELNSSHLTLQHARGAIFFESGSRRGSLDA